LLQAKAFTFVAAFRLPQIALGMQFAVQNFEESLQADHKSSASSRSEKISERG